MAVVEALTNEVRVFNNLARPKRFLRGEHTKISNCIKPLRRVAAAQEPTRVEFTALRPLPAVIMTYPCCRRGRTTFLRVANKTELPTIVCTTVLHLVMRRSPPLGGRCACACKRARRLDKKDASPRGFGRINVSQYGSPASACCIESRKSSPFTAGQCG
jgi:hypothetical protein